MIRYRITLATGSCIVFFADKEVKTFIDGEEYMTFIKNDRTVASMKSDNIQKIQVI